MDRRISFGLFSVALALTCAGCITTQNKDASSLGTPSADGSEVPANLVRKGGGPKRIAQPKTEIAYGQMKETEAESDAAKNNPEAQARLRDEARKAYQAALHQDPNNLDAYRRLARLYTKCGDYDRAFKTYQEAMAKDPKGTPWYDLGSWLASDKGASHCKDAPLWYDLGLCYQRRKDLPESVKCFNKALEIDPENREYMKKLGFTLAYMGQIDQGLALLTRAQGAALAHYGIARVLVQRDQVQQAQHHLRIALRENGQLEEARELLANLSNPSGDAAQRTSATTNLSGARAARE
jgi:tetratricopeptide (TPR) repeat protein